MYTTCSAKIRASDKDLPVAKDSSMPTQKERSLASSAATSTSPTPSSKSSESSNISIHREKVQKDPNTLTIFARKGQFSGNPSMLKRGVVENVDGEKCFGFIKSDAGRKSNIYFHLSKVVNTLATDVIIQNGSKVRYEVQPDSKDKPRASVVYLDFQSVSQTSGIKGSGGSWLKGEIVDKKEYFCFIRPLEPLPRAYPAGKDVYLSLKFVSNHSLGLDLGDLVEFRLGARNPEKVEASSFKVLNYKSKDSDDLISFMDEKSKIIKEKPNIAGELLSERGLWLTLSEQAYILSDKNSSNRNFPHFVKFFLDFLVTVLGNASVHKQAAKELVKALSETSFFKAEGGLLKLVQEGLGDTNLICEVLFNMVTVYPEYNATCSTILEAQNNKEDSGVLQSWLYKFYKLSLCNHPELNMSTTGKKGFILKIAFISWSCLHLFTLEYLIIAYFAFVYFQKIILPCALISPVLISIMTALCFINLGKIPWHVRLLDTPDTQL